MPNPTKCVLCNSAANFKPITEHENKITCERCGNYKLIGTAETPLRDTPIQNRGAVSGWIRRQNGMGITPRITSSLLKNLEIGALAVFLPRVLGR